MTTLATSTSRWSHHRPEIGTLIIGGGIIGVAIARVLARRGDQVVVVDSEPRLATHASARSSEVVHAGLHYRPGSLKARLCVTGRARLYAFCRAHHVGHRAIGKLIIANSPSECDQLERIATTARACGVDDLVELDARQLRAAAPALRGVAALLSPSSGIVDSEGLVRALWADASHHGAQFVGRCKVVRLTPSGDGFAVHAQGSVVQAARLVIAAGPGAATIMANLDGFPSERIPPTFLAKGTYFSLRGAAPVTRLVYPTPDPTGGALGIHLTLDLSGATRFGPDLEWIDSLDYAVDPDRAGAFYSAIRRYWPGLPDGALRPAYAGVRSKLHGPGEPPADFVISGPNEHGLAGLVALFGIESPGLTASLAIAEEVMLRLSR